MATAEEVRVLSKEVNNLSDTIVGVADATSKDQVIFKKFLKSEREELSSSIDAAAVKLDKSSKASLWLSSAIALFACVEASSIFYDVVFSKSNQKITDCVAIAKGLNGDIEKVSLTTHELEIGSYLIKNNLAHDYTTAFVACNKINSDAK